MAGPFDLPDPFQGAFSTLGAPTAQPANRQAALPPLPPEEEQSLLEKIGSAGLGGLAWLGGILNKPGRIVRGLIGGQPREALNVIPFSDALGITKPEQEVRGQDLLGAKDAPFFSPEGLAGFGIDVATDPLTYLSFGGSALSKAGVAAKKAGTLPPTIAERVAQGLGGHVGVGLPGMGNAATFNLSPLAQALGSGVQTVASAIPGGTTALNAVQAAGQGLGNLYTKTIPPLFEAAVMGRKTAPVQGLAREVTAGIPGATAEARGLGMQLTKIAVENGLEGESGARLINQLMEVPGNPLEVAAQVGQYTPQQVKAGVEITDMMRGRLASDLQKQVEGGRPAYELAKQKIAGTDLDLGYLPRQKTLEEPKTFGDYLRSKTPKLEPEHARQDWTTGLTKNTLNDMAKGDLSPAANSHLWDAQSLEEIQKLNPEQQIQRTVLDKYLGGQKYEKSVQELTDAVTADKLAHQGVVTDTEQVNRLRDAEATMTALRNQAASIAKMKSSDTLPLFANHPIVDFVGKVNSNNINFLKQDGVYKTLGKIAGAATEDSVPVMEALGKMWKPTETAGESLAAGGHTAPLGAQVKMAEALGTTVDKLGDFHVPPEIVKDMTGLTRAQSINGMEEFTKLWDSATNLTKAGQTMFPSTVVRNMTQDVFNKIVYGMHDPSFSVLDPRRYTQPIQDWLKVANGGTVEGLGAKLAHVEGFAGLDDAAVAAKLRDMYTAWDVGRNATKRTMLQAGEVADAGIGQAQRSLESLMPVSEAPNPLTAYAKGFKEGSLSPKSALKVAGVAGQTEDVFAPVKAMRAANNASDTMMRGSSWLAKLEQGFVPEEAFREMMKAHYDFGNLSTFERGVMRRVFPFYNWARQNVPAVVQEIAELPGGKLATAVKATVAMRGEHPGFIPPQIQEGVAAPIGAEEGGQQKYLTNTGLGFEDIGRLAGPGGPLGMLNPLIKAPIEQLTGKQMFTGRDLGDLHSRLGLETPIPLLENALANSPVGRLVNTFGPSGTLADERKNALEKAANFLTGVRTSDVNVEQARRTAVLDYIRNALHGPGISRFEDLSVKPQNLPQLSPLEQQLYQLYRVQQSRRPPLPTGSL